MASWIRQNKTLLIHLLILLAVSLVAFIYYYAPVLYGDDWAIFPFDFIFQHSAWLHLASRRPLEIFPAKLIGAIFGLNINAFYAANILFLYLSGVAFYLLVRRFFPLAQNLALAASLVYLVYPVDYSRMWLTMYLMHLIILLAFIYALLLHDYIRRGLLSTWIWAMVTFTIPLFAYEAQLGICLVWSAGLAVLSKGISLRRRLFTLAPVLMGILYAIWRMVGLRLVGIYDTYALNRFDLSPSLLVERLGVGFRIFSWSWIDPARQWIRAGSTNRFIALLILIMILLGGFGWVMSRLILRNSNVWEPGAKNQAVRNLFGAGVFGLVLFLAGYFPIITVYDPNLDNTLSRVNLFAIPGAALFLVSSISLIVSWASRSWRQLDWAVPAALLPLLLIGIGVQNKVQLEASKAWKDQVQVWQDLFVLAPDLTDGTQVVFVFPGYNRLQFGQRPPLQEIWMAHDGVKVLYNNVTLSGSILFLDINMGNEPKFTPSGLTNTWAQDNSYAKAVFVYFDPSTGKMRLIEDLRSEFHLSFDPAGYNPRNNILGSQSPTETRFRYLVDNPPG